MNNVSDAESYGLHDQAILEQATHLNPALFAALGISQQVDSSHFPITSDADIEVALAAVVDDRGVFESPGVTITRDSARDSFPNDFLPIRDKLDLVRKVYIAILIDHESKAKLQRIRDEENPLSPKASHPLPGKD